MMPYKTAPLVVAAFTVLACTTLAGANPVPPAEPVAVAADVMPPAPVPIVPLPPGLTGSVAAVVMIGALRYSRHRRWVTLR